MRAYISKTIAIIPDDGILKPIEEFPKVHDGEFSIPVCVVCNEFGFSPEYVVARAWKSSASNAIRFYLDPTYYRLPNYREVGLGVTHFYYSPKAWKQGKHELVQMGMGI